MHQYASIDAELQAAGWQAWQAEAPAILPAAAFQAAFSSYARASYPAGASGKPAAAIHAGWSPVSKVSGIRLPTAAVTVFSETQ
jgi:hypothetical protein